VPDRPGFLRPPVQPGWAPRFTIRPYGSLCPCVRTDRGATTRFHTRHPAAALVSTDDLAPDSSVETTTRQPMARAHGRTSARRVVPTNELPAAIVPPDDCRGVASSLRTSPGNAIRFSRSTACPAAASPAHRGRLQAPDLRACRRPLSCPIMDVMETTPQPNQPPTARTPPHPTKEPLNDRVRTPSAQTWLPGRRGLRVRLPLSIFAARHRSRPPERSLSLSVVVRRSCRSAGLLPRTRQLPPGAPLRTAVLGSGTVSAGRSRFMDGFRPVSVQKSASGATSCICPAKGLSNGPRGPPATPLMALVARRRPDQGVTGGGRRAYPRSPGPAPGAPARIRLCRGGNACAMCITSTIPVGSTSTAMGLASAVAF